MCTPENNKAFCSNRLASRCSELRYSQTIRTHFQLKTEKKILLKIWRISSILFFISNEEFVSSTNKTWRGQRKEFMSSSRYPDWLWGSPSLLSHGIKRLGREAHNSSPSNAKVKNAWSFTSTLPYVCMAWCLINHRILLLGVVFG
jgi:hypothetical protein